MTEQLGHWSDCAVHNEPAMPNGPCNCGGLDLAAYERYRRVTSLIPTPRSLADFIANGEAPCLVQTHQFEASALTANATATDLPDAHNGIVSGTGANGVDFDKPGITIIGDGETLSFSQSIACNVPPHQNHPRKWFRWVIYLVIVGVIICGALGCSAKSEAQENAFNLTERVPAINFAVLIPQHVLVFQPNKCKDCSFVAANGIGVWRHISSQGQRQFLFGTGREVNWRVPMVFRIVRRLQGQWKIMDQRNSGNFETSRRGITEIFNAYGNHGIVHRAFVCKHLNPYREYMRAHIRKGDLIALLHGYAGIARINHSLTGVIQGPEQADSSGDGNPETPLCPKCAILSGPRSYPLGTKIAFILPLWILAGHAVFKGLGWGSSPRRNLKWLIGGIAIGLIPLLFGMP